MTAVYFDDLVDSKKVILTMAEIDVKHLKMEEAKFLIHQMNSYYLKTSDTDDKYKLLRKFTTLPREFKHNELLKQLEIDNLKLEQFK